MKVSKRTNVCMFCKCQSVRPSLDTFLANYKGCILIVKNVPCEECEQCGAKYYPDSVMEKLEQITNEAKSRMQELTVTDYSRVA